MSKILEQIVRSAKKLIIIQVATALAVAILIGLLYDLKSGWSALLGAAVCVIPNVYFIGRIFRRDAYQTPEKFIRTFYMAEIIKLLIMALLFVFILNSVEINPLAFIVGFIATQLSFWLAPVVFR